MIARVLVIEDERKLRRNLNRLSIRWRITLWNTVAFAVVLAGFGVLVYGLVQQIHYDQVDDVRLRRFGDEAIVEVRDTGIGIPPEHLPRLFDRFYRVARDGSRHGGAGLGLSIAHGSVVASGGRIEVESEVAKGTVFQIVLPVMTRRGSRGPIADGTGTRCGR